MPRIYPSLWFKDDADEAVNYHLSIFKDGEIIQRNVLHNSGPNQDMTVVSIEFRLFNQTYNAFNGGPHNEFNDSVSFIVECDSQEEIDNYWSALTANGGQEVACGWLNDKYGIRWQIVPRGVDALLNDDDPEMAKKKMNALLSMVKIDIATLQNPQ